MMTTALVAAAFLLLVAAFFFGVAAADRFRGIAPRFRRPEQWSIGIFRGEHPLALRGRDEPANPVLTAACVTDLDADFVADPFMLHVDDLWYMFFEVVDRRDKKGAIGLATSADAVRWSYECIVLEEPFHLSYPCVFQWNDRYFMVPESRGAGAVRLYCADRFPYDWKPVATLLLGTYDDPTLFRHEGRWWMFAAVWHKQLRLFSASELTGPWLEHPCSPVVDGDPHTARPAGRVLQADGRLYRFAQDCVPVYGRQVFAFEITRLTLDEYEERQVGTDPTLSPGEGTWNGVGMHHLDAHPLASEWVACVDGYAGRRLLLAWPSRSNHRVGNVS